MKTGILALLLVVAACNKKDEAVTVVAMTTAGPSASSVVPVDHLAPGELLEGDAKAFGLVLPRGVRIDAAFADVVYATGQVSKDSAVKYIRSHVREGKLIEPTASERVTFDQVRLPAMPDKTFVVYIEPAKGAVATTKIEVHDVTPLQAPVLPDEAARWAAAGLKPNGQPLDPTHFQ